MIIFNFDKSKGFLLLILLSTHFGTLTTIYAAESGVSVSPIQDLTSEPKQRREITC